MEKTNRKPWSLLSGFFPDGGEALVLKNGDGTVICEYAENKSRATWHQYFNGFPKKEFVSREGCLKSAERIAGQKLSVTNLGQGVANGQR